MIEIWKTRKEMNEVCDKKMRTMSKHLDVIAYGLKSLRDSQTDLIKEKIKKGLKIRILTMHPENIFLKYKEQEEQVKEGSIKNDIYDLVIWIDKLKHIAYESGFSEDNIQIKFYKILPLDFYFKVDYYIFYGGNMYNKTSQESLSFGYDSFGLLFTAYLQYSKYFEYLWRNKNIQNDFQRFFFTFGFGQQNEGYAQKVYATSWDKAREKMVEKHQIKWAFQYTEAEWNKNKKEYDFKEKFIEEIII